MAERGESKQRYQKLKYENWPLVSENSDLQTAFQAANEAGKLLHKGFYSRYQTHVNSDKSEHTPFDVQAEVIGGEHIRKAEPKAVIMGEDLTPNQDITGRSFWVIDGIDGTTNFSRGIRTVNFTMAKVVDGLTTVGIVFDFLHGEAYYSVRGQGAYKNGQRMHVSERPFEESVISFAPLLDVRRGKGPTESEQVEATWRGMKIISEESGRFHREFQSGGYELSLVASGQLDGYASSWTSPWDLSAGVLNVRESGGVATNIHGEDWEPSNYGVVAGNPAVHGRMITVFQNEFAKLRKK